VLKNDIGTRKQACILRRSGKSHRDIAKLLGIGLGSAFVYTKNIRITKRQHLRLMQRGIIKLHERLTEEEFKDACQRGGRNNQHKFKIKYTRQQLIDKIKEFRNMFERIPTKREFYNHWQPFRRVFGSWNRAILAAGFKPNPVLFANKWQARDGHSCDSLSEKIIDDFLSRNNISHERGVFYPDQKKFKTDFLINGKYWIEFVGLKGVLKRYDLLFRRKKALAKKNGIKIVEICPQDLFPKERLASCFAFLK
jgi:hypothetical protein